LAEEVTISTKRVFEGRVVNLRVDTIRTAGGAESTREIVEHAPCIAVIPVDKDSNILLVKQFRKPVEKELLEIPAGGIEPGEDPEDAVQRELREEIGYKSSKLEALGGFYSVPGYSSEYLYIFLAEDLVPSRLQGEDTDEIDVVRMPLEEVVRLIGSGEICDGKSLAAMFLLNERRKRKHH
jgi:ADP-ribose pyrophosphatase